MSLWTDNYAATMPALRASEPEIDGVLIHADMGEVAALADAYQQASARLEAALVSSGGVYGGFGVGAAHAAAVLNVQGYGGNYPRAKLHQVVLENPEYPGMDSPLRNWAVQVALAKIYLKASSRKQGDRYERKAERYAAEAAAAWNLVCSLGVPVIDIPLPAPGALFYPGAGEISLAPFSAYGAPAQSYSVRLTWTSATGESGPSPIISLSTLADSGARVSIADLKAPDGKGGSSYLGALGTIAATGWHVYAASSPDGPYRRQTASPLPLDTTAYDFTAAPSTSGAKVGSGQSPTSNLFLLRHFDRV